MIYGLQRSGGAPDQATLAEADLPHTAAALAWAQRWLRNRNGAERYRLVSADDTFSADLVRTAGGQWYAIGR